ncbi:hypothetical protein [Aeromicrobium sp. UC242_57]|uniref:hypothetical protein n=1 Tax=Aeromicrobium sp. UC242_57 TaxID=3374624 RepID=UPI0037AA6AB4
MTALAVSAAYALWVTAPTVSRSGEVGLTAEGGFFDFAPFAPSLVLGVLLALALLTTRSTGDTWSRTGALALGVAAAVGLAALLRQRLGADVSWWGYYPQKYAWVLCVLAVVMTGRFVAQAVSVDLRRRRDSIAAPLVVVGAALAVMLVAPPSASPLVAPGVRQVAPALTIIDAEHGTLADDLGYLSSAAPVLFAHSGPGGPVVLSRYLTDDVTEDWVNEWTVEIAQQEGSTVSRRDVQRLDLRQATGLCELLATSDRPVRVLSRDAGLRDRVADQCPEESPIWTLDD